MTASIGKPVVCFGEVLLRLSPPGKELLLQSRLFESNVGGAEVNVAVSLQSFGHNTRMVSTAPDSPLGRACVAEVRRHGVNVQTIHYREGRMGMYFLTHGAGHRPAEVLYDRTNSAFADTPPGRYDWSALLQDASWLHVSGITPAVSTAAAQAALAATEAARRLGVKVSFDCNFRARLWASRAAEAPRILRALCERADLIFGDERDFAFILEFKQEAGLQEASRRRSAAEAAFGAFGHLQHIACTSRDRLSVEVQALSGWLHTRADTWTSRAYPLQGIVDRIGAGDAFAAGVLHGLLSGFESQKVVDFATAAACLKHSIPGDANLVSTTDVELLLSQEQTDVRR